MGKKSDAEIQKAIQQFAIKYGLFGFMTALAMTMTDKPMAVNKCFQWEYAEPYHWMKQHSMIAFGGIAPTYHIALLDKPTIVWEFHSLMLGIQMRFSFMLTDSENPIRLCKH